MTKPTNYLQQFHPYHKDLVDKARDGEIPASKAVQLIDRNRYGLCVPYSLDMMDLLSAGHFFYHIPKARQAAVMPARKDISRVIRQVCTRHTNDYLHSVEQAMRNKPDAQLMMQLVEDCDGARDCSDLGRIVVAGSVMPVDLAIKLGRQFTTDMHFAASAEALVYERGETERLYGLKPLDNQNRPAVLTTVRVPRSEIPQAHVMLLQPGMAVANQSGLVYAAFDKVLPNGKAVMIYFEKIADYMSTRLVQGFHDDYQFRAGTEQHAAMMERLNWVKVSRPVHRRSLFKSSDLARK